MRQNQGPPQAIEFFWADSSGGLAAVRRTQIGVADIPDDGDFHVFQIDMTGVFQGIVNVIRFDPGNLAGTTFDFDYIRLGTVGMSEPPVITGIIINELDEAEVTWSSQKGARYDLEASEDLIDWEPINDEPIEASPGDSTTYIDLDSLLFFPIRYYRVVQLRN